MIVHLDADAFFASVEQAADVKLRGKAIAVGGERRGIIASASYEARKMGVYTPMPTARARKICPKLIVLPGDFEQYERFSRLMFSYAYDFTPEVEVASIDEGYFDLRQGQKKSPREIAEIIRRAIAQSLKIPVSEGIGSNKLVSQIASKLNKPKCFIEVLQGDEKQFLGPLPNKWLPMVGPKLETTLNAAGLSSIRQIAETPADLLSMLVGNYAPQLKAYANGIDDRQVIRDAPEAKSYSEQQTFNVDTTDENFILATLRAMADRLASKVRGSGNSFRTITVKIRYNDMQDVIRSFSLKEPTDSEYEIYPYLRVLLNKAWERRVSLRLVSLKLSQIYGGIFAVDFALDQQSRRKANQRKLADVMDGCRGQYTLMRGHDLWLQKYTPKAELARKQPISHPAKRSIIATNYLPLNVKSHYSFLDSTLSISDIIAWAKRLGMPAVAITDPNLHGSVEFYHLAIEAGIQPIIAAELKAGSKSYNAYVQDQTGYGNLCRLLTFPDITADMLTSHKTGLLFVETHSTKVALPEIRYGTSEDRTKFQIIQSIRTLTLLDELHPEKHRGNYHFPTQQELIASYSEEAIAATFRLPALCQFHFDLHHLRFPRYNPKDGTSPVQFLSHLAHDGLTKRYGQRASLFQPQLAEELAMIAEVGYEEYFLVVWDILQKCRQRGIQWITRGSAADSLVCYCLEISGVCPIRFDLYFKRFLNKDRMALNKLPDIDLDFAHDRKDDVVDLIFKLYGNTYAAIVGGFNTYQGRSAIADIAKVLGVSEYQIRRVTEHVPYASAVNVARAIQVSQETRDCPWGEEPYKTALEMAGFLDGFPRHAKMHPCGVVLSRDPILSLTPTFVSAKGYPTTHFDMDSVEAVGLIKMDILAQGGLAVIRDTLSLLKDRGIVPDLEHLEPWDDQQIWRMIASGHARGVHHIESPAMLNLAKMCQVKDIDCLIAIVSVIRPGAANGSKKADFARRARGVEAAQYPHPSLVKVLRSTYGVVAYEEHILQICEEFAGLQGGRADVLRRALVKEKQTTIAEIKLEFFASAKKLGRTAKDTETVWELVNGFQGYAFCKAHSTAYGVEAYQGAYLKHYHPAEFLASILTNGKGFYSLLAYTMECRRLGIGFLLPDINLSEEKFFTVAGKTGPMIRLPLAQIKGLATQTLENHRREKCCGDYVSITAFMQRVQPSLLDMQNLIRVGAFDGFGLSRPEQFWEAQSMGRWPKNQGFLFSTGDQSQIPNVHLTPPSHLQMLKNEMELLGFTVSSHPLDLHPEIAWNTYCPSSAIHKYLNQEVTVCGLIIADRLHTQQTGEKMKFITLCDYSGIIDCEIFADAYRIFGIYTIRYPVIEVTAKVITSDETTEYSLQVIRVGKPRLKSEMAP